MASERIDAALCRSLAAKVRGSDDVKRVRNELLAYVLPRVRDAASRGRRAYEFGRSEMVKRLIAEGRLSGFWDADAANVVVSMAEERDAR